ncbi:myelin and lymphocyte protein-like [Pelodytes ibericus]
MEGTNAAPVYADVTVLPSGPKVWTTLPDALMFPELIFGGLVWILIASALVADPVSQGWIMFVSVTLFVATFIIMIMYAARLHKGMSVWTTFDAAYHGVAALFYLSAFVLQAYVTIVYGILASRSIGYFQIYQRNIAAVVFACIASLLYVVHAVMSLLRWKKSP